MLAAATLVAVVAFAAFTVDIGYITLTKTQLQAAVDAAVLAGAMELDGIAAPSDVEVAVKQAVVEVAALNRAGDHDSVFINPDTDVQLGRREWNSAAGDYTYAFGPQATPYNIVRVTAYRTLLENAGPGITEEVDRRLPLFFAPILGHAKVSLEVSAMATFQPRDMMLVLDYSASMNDDSELRSIGKLGQQAVVDNIYQMWLDLGSPTYGNLQFDPDWVTIPGSRASVKWRTSKVDVTANDSIQRVKLYYSNGKIQYFNTSGNSGTFSGTGSNKGKRITKTKVKVNGKWETFNFYDNATIKKGLGLNGVPYPYPSGSWQNYIDYARNHSSSMPWYDGNVYKAGFRRKFGMLTLINFWNKNKPKYSQTPDLWTASQQPITSLKDATDLLLDYLTSVEAEDTVGLSVYTYPSSEGAKLESGLTENFDLIKSISRQRQAGHYDYYTNIGAGMRTARLELINNARPKAFRMMVLMTDGLANRSSTSASPIQFVLNEADLAAGAKIKIMTISLGVNADAALMQQVADLTGGVHFNVPGGSSVDEYQQQLKDVFIEIASDRHLKLIRDPDA